jgi:hypothetical protein
MKILGEEEWLKTRIERDEFLIGQHKKYHIFMPETYAALRKHRIGNPCKICPTKVKELCQLENT